LAHGGIEAARRLVERGNDLTLGTAVGLDRADDIRRLASVSDEDERLVALTVAAFYGKTEWIAFLLSLGVNPNGFPRPTGFHTHATPLHQAVSSGSLAAVRLLVEVGADLTAKDRAHNGTPLGWARYMQNEESPDTDSQGRYAAIAEFLHLRGAAGSPPST
jgi:peptide-methionine (S)-S-oxide reductase